MRAMLSRRKNSVQTLNGNRIAVGMELDYATTTSAEREAILAGEAAYKERQRKLPRKRKPDYMKAGPVSWVQL